MDWYVLVPSIKRECNSSVIGPFPDLKKAQDFKKAIQVFASNGDDPLGQYGFSVEQMDCVSHMPTGEGVAWIARLVTPDRWPDMPDTKDQRDEA